ncbi:MAG: hypothetical protein ACKPKO_59275, partial [Candidatus Fonsibacter sp.]
PGTTKDTPTWSKVTAGSHLSGHDPTSSPSAEHGRVDGGKNVFPDDATDLNNASRIFVGCPRVPTLQHGSSSTGRVLLTE